MWGEKRGETHKLKRLSREEDAFFINMGGDGILLGFCFMVSRLREHSFAFRHAIIACVYAPT